VQDGRIYIEKINEPFLYRLMGTPAEYKAGLERSIANGWLALILMEIRMSPACGMCAGSCGTGLWAACA
jgi:hypothetical protein